MKSSKKKLNGVLGVVILLLYTMLVVQIVHAFKKPEVITEYIKVEVPVVQEVVEEVEVVINEAVNEKEWLRNIPLSEELQKHTWDLANKYDLSYDMILAIMKQESNFNPKATNKNTNGSQDSGIMQINSVNRNYVSELAGRKLDLFNTKDNVLAGVLILNQYRHNLIDKGITSQEELFERLLLSYNRGIGGGSKYIANRGTARSDYVKKVLNYKIQLESEGGI